MKRIRDEEKPFMAVSHLVWDRSRDRSQDLCAHLLGSKDQAWPHHSSLLCCYWDLDDAFGLLLY